MTEQLAKRIAEALEEIAEALGTVATTIICVAVVELARLLVGR